MQIFARVVYLSHISGSDSPWSFLSGVKATGSPVPRSLLVDAAASNVSLLTQMSAMARSGILIGSAEKYANPLLLQGTSRIITFFTAIVVEVAEKFFMEDAQLRILYPFIADGLKGSLKHNSLPISGPAAAEWLRASCVILCQIARKTPLAKPFVDGVVSAMFQRFTALCEQSMSARKGINCHEIVMGFMVFSQSQQVYYYN